MSTDSNQSGCTEKKFRIQIVFTFLAVALTLTGVILVGCSGSSPSSTATGMAKVSVMLSDPSTCMAPTGPYQHVYVTVTDRHM